MPGFTRPVGAVRQVGVPKRRCVGFSLAHCWVISPVRKEVGFGTQESLIFHFSQCNS